MRFNAVALLGVLALAASTATAAVSSYVVGYGDTLSDIALQFYGDAEYWDEILAANTWLSSPEALQPGMQLILPDIAGAYRPSSSEVYTQTYVQAPTLLATAPILSRIRLEEAGFIGVDPVPAIARIVGVNVEEPADLANDDAYAGDLVEFDLGSAGGVTEGEIFRILSPGETVVNPETGSELGPVMRVAGICRVVGVTSSTSVALLEQSSQATRAGDLVEAYVPAVGIPVNNSPTADDISVWVVALQDSDAVDAYAFDVIYLNRGSESGLRSGDVFQAFKYGTTATGLEGDIVETADIPIAEVVILSVQRTTCSAIASLNRTSDLLVVGDRLHLSRRQAASATR
jgi:phage tail protein X